MFKNSSDLPTRMSLDEAELRRIFSGKQGWPSGSEPYRREINYQPTFFLRQQEEEEENGKLKLIVNGPEEMVGAPELAPTHLAAQGIESGIDAQAGNAIFVLPEGRVRIGFYDRAKADEANALAKSKDDPTFGLADLVNGTDTLLPKLELLPTQPFVSNLLGSSFPPMFNFRSVSFQGDTKYGVVVAVDEAIMGQPATFENLLLDPDFIKSHPAEMNFLFPLIVKAAQEKGLALDDLILSGSIDVSSALQYLYALNRRQYETRVSYRRTPQLVVAARLNGVPVGLSVSDAGHRKEFAEVGFPGREVDGLYVATVSRGFVHNAANPADSIEGDLLYERISREESVGLSEENQQFGLLEVQVMKGYSVDGFVIEFRKVKKDAPLLLPAGRGADDSSTYAYAQGGGLKGLTSGGGFTAGHSTVGELRSAKVETVPFAFERVLLRDAFCLVHGEPAVNASRYEKASTAANN